MHKSKGYEKRSCLHSKIVGRPGLTGMSLLFGLLCEYYRDISYMCILKVGSLPTSSCIFTLIMLEFTAHDKKMETTITRANPI